MHNICLCFRWIIWTYVNYFCHSQILQLCKVLSRSLFSLELGGICRNVPLWMGSCPMTLVPGGGSGVLSELCSWKALRGQTFETRAPLGSVYSGKDCNSCRVRVPEELGLLQRSEGDKSGCRDKGRDEHTEGNQVDSGLLSSCSVLFAEPETSCLSWRMSRRPASHIDFSKIYICTSSTSRRKAKRLRQFFGRTFWSLTLCCNDGVLLPFNELSSPIWFYNLAMLAPAEKDTR